MNSSVDIEDMRSRGIRRAATVLRDQGMPSDELDVVLTTPDHELVRRHLELHVERLEERLTAQRRMVAEIEKILGDRALVPAPTRRSTDEFRLSDRSYVAIRADQGRSVIYGLPWEGERTGSRRGDDR
jgi:hypothetical protein